MLVTVVAAAASFSWVCWLNSGCGPNLCIPPSGSHHRLMSGGFVNTSPVVYACARRISMVCVLLNSDIDTHNMNISQMSTASMDQAAEIPQTKCLRTTACFSHAVLPEPKQVSEMQCKENISFFTAIGAATMCTLLSHFIPCLYIFKMYLFKSIFSHKYCQSSTQKSCQTHTCSFLYFYLCEAFL